jgi:hypothetical protein
VLDGADGPSSLVASLSMVVELLEDRVNVVAANGVCWGTRSTLVAILLHVLEFETELELLRSRSNMNLVDDQVGALWTQAHLDSDSLATQVLPLVAHNPLDDVE